MAMQLLTQSEAANFLRLSPKTLEAKRRIGNGPQYCKIGRRVLYEQDVLENYVAECRCRSTTEYSK